MDICAITIISLLNMYKEGNSAMLILNPIYLFQYLKAVLPTSASTMKYNHSMGLVAFFPKCFSMERLVQAVQVPLEV